MTTSKEQPPFEIPAYFEALNMYGKPVAFTVNFSDEFTYFNVDGGPVAFVPDVDGGMGIVFFSDPPQLYSSFRAMNDGELISKEEFGRLVNQYREEDSDG